MALTNVQIDKIMFNNPVTNKTYLGTFPSDELPTSIVTGCFITNTDPHYMRGSHWNAFYLSDGIVDFYDSYGRSPYSKELPASYRQFLKNRRYRFNHQVVEDVFSVMCGEFCIFFIYNMNLGLDLKFISKCFSKNLYRNDQSIKRFIQNIM